MSNEMVTVVTTVYNGIEHFDKAVPSVLSQSYINFEWIIVDDGSNDGTLEKLYQIAESDPRVKVINEGKMGRTKALNYAISLASTDFIFQQDFDDISHPDRLSLQYSFLKENPNVGLVGGYYEIHNEIRGESFLRKPPLEFEEVKNAMAKYIPICHTISAFRKMAWLDAGQYDENYNDIIDLRFYISLISSGWEARNLSHNLGVHFVYSDSNYIKANRYATRQKHFRKLNIKAIKEFKLSYFNYFYVFGRYFYYLFPAPMKRTIRRGLRISNEDRIS
ncbi:glycosyltransferase family 2 protein [Vibrio hangzhouensis]|uniref:glycosyltransferase family 2 protein n=1 Tax=Vibrio hangzhouensis TaxID=462991 RepID=UPI001C95BC0C|nr:glycosyltransferase family 2 protein [Vibrio hangzhouensis]MBY6198479.1 glycosyltransferase family 2 protein [Vibrio hangzhouensis]